MSLSNLLVDNNFTLASTGGGNDIAEALYSNNNENIVSVKSSPNPSSNQVLKAIDANNARWQDETITEDNAIEMTNKVMTDPSNILVSSGLLSNGGSNTISIREASNPSVDQVLTAINANQAEWKDVQRVPPSNGAEGGFTRVSGGAGPVPITTIDFGDRRGSFVLEMLVTAVSNVGRDMTSWKISAGFLIPPDTNTIEQVQTTTISRLFHNGVMTGEPAPSLILGPNDTSIQLQKNGVPLDNTFWGGTWKYTASGF